MAQGYNEVRRRVKWQAAAAVSTVFLTGCGGSNPNVIAAHKISDVLPTVIGPAKHYEVSVEGDPFATARGHVKRVHIDGKDVQLAPSMNMNQLHIDADDLVVDTKTKQLDHTGPVHFTGAMGQLRLDQYLAGIKPGIQGLSVQIRWTDLEASVPVSAVGVNTTVRVDGTLSPSRYGRDKLDFIPSGAEVGPVPVPRKLVELAMDRINPVLDLSTLKFPVVLESAQAQNGRLYIAGSTTLQHKE